MPLSPGIVFRSSSTATGTTGVSLSLPSGVADGDILIMCLSHYGAGWATVPGGWTLVAQEIQGTLRGEMYWKRASSETGPYSVSGVATSISGAISAFKGCVASGSPIDAFAARANPSGLTSSLGPFTTNTPMTMVVPMKAVDATSTALGFSVGRHTVDPFYTTIPEMESSIGSTALVASNPNKATLAVGGQIKTQAGSTVNDIYAVLSPAAPNVCIIAALLPDTARTSGTRYYFTGKNPGLPNRETWLLQGDWDGGFISQLGTEPMTFNNTMLLDQLKNAVGFAEPVTQGGIAQNVTSQQGDVDLTLGRWMTRPLQAATLSGTLDLCVGIMSSWEDGPIDPWTNETVAQLKLHAYITVGQTQTVRQVLVPNYIDPAIIPAIDHNQVIFVNLTAPQSISGGIVQDGDSIVIELGVRIVSAPVEGVDYTQTYPPTYFSMINFMGIGGSTSATIDDPVAGYMAWLPPSYRRGYFDFTDTILEKADPAPPANTSASAALSVTALPYTGPVYDTSGATSPSKEVWYRFTATQDGDVVATVLNAQNLVVITALKGPLASLDQMNSTKYPSFRSWFVQRSYQRPLHATVFPVVAGTEYFVRVYSAVPSEGAGTKLNLAYRDTTPQSGDVYLPCGLIVALRDGVVINVNGYWSDYTPSGCAIDYTRRPMHDIADGSTNTSLRLYVQMFGFADLIEIFDLPTLDVTGSEVDYIFDPLVLSSGRVTRQLSTIHMDPAGTLTIGTFGNGFLYVRGQNLPQAASLMNTVSDNADLGYVRQMDGLHAENQSGAPWPLASELATPPEVTSAWGVAVSEDGNTLYYTSGSFYRPFGGQAIRRWDIPTNSALPDLAVMPVVPGGNPGVRGISVIPSRYGGGFLVCNGAYVHLLDPAGAIVRTFTPSYPGYAWLSMYAYIVPGGQSFWVSDEWSAAMIKINIQTGVQELLVETGLRVGTHTQFAVLDLGDVPVIPPEPDETYDIRWLRRGPHLSHEQERIRHNSFQLDMQTGVGTASGDGSDPKVMLRWSDDGGHTWSQRVHIPAGKIGKYTVRALARRLGRSRDRIYEVSGTDPVVIALLSGILHVEKGTS